MSLQLPMLELLYCRTDKIASTYSIPHIPFWVAFLIISNSIRISSSPFLILICSAQETYADAALAFITAGSPAQVPTSHGLLISSLTCQNGERKDQEHYG